MKKVISLALSSVLFFVVSFSYVVAADSLTGELLGHMVACEYSKWSEVPEAGRQLAEAYVDLFKSTDLNSYFKSVEDVDISWLKMVGTTQYVLSPFPTVAYILNESGVLEVEKSTHGGFGGRHRVGNEHDDIVVDSDILKKAVNTANNEYSPKSTGKYISYRTDEYYGNNGESNCLLPLYNGGFCGERWSEVYLMPFYTDGEDRYYSEYQLHFYLERVDNENGDGWTTTFAVDWFSNFDDIDSKKGTKIIKEGMTSPEYVVLSSTPDGYNRFFSYMYPFLSQFLERPHSGSCSHIFYGPDTFRYYKSGDLSSWVESNLYNHFCYSYSNHDGSCLYGSSDDIGYYYSNTPIMFSYSNIDTEKIPDSYYITVNGDTIYDYSITNPDTGQSSTINEYITNNYTYITNNNPGGDGSGSGTTGGNVTVGGNIGVNGNVNVGGEVNVGVDVSPIDINVNVSGNGGAGESGGEPPEIGGLDDLVGYLPEKSPAISQYLKIFFDTLPPELLALILAGVAVAVIKLIFRR